jgi:hypothetical protein
MALSPDDVRQIVDALEQLDWVQFVKQQMGSTAEPTPEKPPVEPAPDATGAATPPPKPAAPPPVVPPKGPGEPDKEKLGCAQQRYAADGSADGDDPEKPGTPSVSGASDDALQGKAKATVAGDDDPEDKKGPVKMSRVLADQQALKGEVTQLREQLRKEQDARRYAERYAKLSGLRETLAFDLEAEGELARDFTDQQFERYAASLRRNCQRIPVYYDLPTQEDAAVSDAPDRPGTKGEREKFRKEHSEQALRYCKAKAERGEDVSYEQVLETLRQGKPLPQ